VREGGLLIFSFWGIGLEDCHGLHGERLGKMPWAPCQFPAEVQVTTLKGFLSKPRGPRNPWVPWNPWASWAPWGRTPSSRGLKYPTHPTPRVGGPWAGWGGVFEAPVNRNCFTYIHIYICPYRWQCFFCICIETAVRMPNTERISI
jgi:hypothetical protein